ncbi:MAG: alpha/beta hydrolase [Marinicella sp.]
MRKLVRFTSGLFLNKKCPLWLQRKGLDLLGGFNPLPKGITINKNNLDRCQAWWFNHKNTETNRVILYFHGGGFGIGSPRSHRDLCAHLAKYSETPVVSLKYRLAPEHPYPAAIEDATLAYLTLLKQGYSGDQIALAGDSAGGSLALTLALKLKTEQISQPVCLFLISPWVNKSKETASHLTQFAVDPVINEGWSRQMASNYLTDSTAIQAEACLADKDFTGLSPMLIHVGTDEVLLDDSILLKQKAIKTGVHVTLITYPELWHVFHFSASLFKQAREALKQAGSYIKHKMS